MTDDAGELEQLREKVRQQRAEIAHLSGVLREKNLLLDALHVVWCNGGCPRGVHRFQDKDVLVTEQLVSAAERNTARLRQWYDAVKYRYDTYGPAPLDPDAQCPSTATEWHHQYAERAAARTDIPLLAVCWACTRCDAQGPSVRRMLTHQRETGHQVCLAESLSEARAGRGWLPLQAAE
jgi:hypothetical protein